MSTEAIDRLFLELSQFTQATTAKELAANEQAAYWCKQHNIERARAEAAEVRVAVLESAGQVLLDDVLLCGGRPDHPCVARMIAALSSKGKRV